MEATMYKHILVPVDGSKLSFKAVKSATALARAVKAKVTLFHAAPGYGGVYFMESPALTSRYTAASFKEATDKHAQKVLEQAARQAGMEVQTRHAISEFPYDAIVRAAAKGRCDLIVMASHGRGGIKGFLLGSETQKVLTHTKVPVLVVH
jgi:nucleotide-binding universal stress UspA family protein